MPKVQRTRVLSSAYQNNFFRSYHKFLNKSWSNFTFRILPKHQLQNLNQASAFRPNLSFKISTKPSALESWPRLNSITSTRTRHQQQNTDQTSASKARVNFNFRILTKHSASKSAPSCRPVLHNLCHPTIRDESTWRTWEMFSCFPT